MAMLCGILEHMLTVGQDTPDAEFSHAQQYGIYCTNSFGGGIPGNGGVRHSISPMVSRVNHSCLPTCIVDFDAGEAVSMRVLICGPCCKAWAGSDAHRLLRAAGGPTFPCKCPSRVRTAGHHSTCCRL